MSHERKAEAELLQELSLLRRRVSELERQVADRKTTEQETANPAKLPAEDPNPVLRISTDCTILYANDASSIVLQTWQRQVGQALPEPCCQRAKEALSSGKVSTFEFNCVDRRIFLVTLAPVAQEGYLNAYGVDITERRKAQDALLESENRYRDLIEGLSDVIYTTNAEGIVTSVNKAEKVVFGRDTTEIVGRHFTSSLMPKSVLAAIAGFKRVLAGESITIETVALHKNGKPLNIELSCTPIIRDGVVVGARGIIRDVTDRKKIENELQESQKKYRELVDNINDGVYQTDTKGNFTYVNKIIEERSGIPAEKFVGLNFRDVVTPEYHQIVKTNFARFLAGEQLPPFELDYRTATGKIITVETNIRPIYDGDTVTGIQGISRDITQRKKAEKKLKESEAALRAIIDSVTESVLLIEPDGTVLAANKTVAERLGTTVDDLVGKSRYDLLPPDVAESRKLQIEKVVRTGESVIFEDVRGARHLLHSFNPIKDSAGKVTRVAIFSFDVTDHKRMEQALQESDLRYRSLFETSPVAFGIATTDGRILDCNSAMVAMTGYSIAEIGQVNLKDTYVNPGERASLLKELRTNGLVRDFQAQLKRKDGTKYWADLTVVPFPFAGENTILTAQMDITERKQAEEALRQSETKYRTLVENLPQRIFLKDKNSVYISCNQNYAGDLGIKPHEIAGKTDYDFYPKEMAEKYRADDGQIVELGQVTDIEEKYILPGQELIVHTVKTPVRDEQRDVVAILGIFWNVTDEKKVQEALITRDKAIASAINPIAFSDEHGILTYVNEAFLKTLGYQDARQVIGKSVVEFAQNKGDAIKAMQQVLTTGSLVGEIGAVRSDGSPIEVQISAGVVRGEDGRIICLMGSFIDITEPRRKERELNLYRERMAQAEQLASLGTLSATVAHELTQPLTTIRLSIENSLAQLGTASCPADILEELKDALDGVSDAVSVVDRIRNFARQSSEKAVTEVNLGEVAERIVRLLDKNAQQADILVQLKDLEKLPPIYAREKDMEQLFFALADNAIRAADGKKKRQLTISGDLEGDRIELRFADNCGGIAPENLDKIFEPFFTTRPAGEGTGLGLTIAQHIVSRAGGRIWVQNKPRKGATFFVTLPIGKGIGR